MYVDDIQLTWTAFVFFTIASASASHFLRISIGWSNNDRLFSGSICYIDNQPTRLQQVPNQSAHTPAFHALDWLSLPVTDSEYNTKWLMAVEWQWADSSVIENKQTVRLKQHFFSVITVDMSHKSVTTFKLPPFYIHYTGQPALASIPSYELENFVGASFYCPHALADSN